MASKQTTRTIPPAGDSSEALLTTKETAALLRCSISALNKWRVRGDGPRFVRLGGRVRYRRADLTRYIADRTRASTSAMSAPAAISP